MKQIQQPKIFDHFGIIILGIVWSWAFIAMRYLSPYLNPSEIAFIRIFIALISLGAIILMFKERYTPNKSDIITILVYGTFGISVPFLMLTTASKTVPGGIMTLMDTLSPLMSIIIAHFLTKDEKINSYKLLSVAIGFTGVSIAVWDGKINGTVDIVGVLLVIGAFLFYILGGYIIRKASHIPPLIFGFYSFIVSAFITFLITVLSDGFSPMENYYTDNVIPVLIFLGLFPSALALWYRIYLTNKLGISFIGTVTYVVPISGVITGHLLLGEALNSYIFISLGLVLFAMWVFSYERK